jgi:preprotein translocase subunit YajC
MLTDNAWEEGEEEQMYPHHQREILFFVCLDFCFFCLEKKERKKRKKKFKNQTNEIGRGES